MRVTVGLALLGLALSRVHLSDLKVRNGSAVLAGVLVAALTLGVALALSAVRWWLVLGRREARFGLLLRLYFVGQFFSLFLPTSIGGDAVRIVALSRTGTATGRAVSSILVERMLGVLALVTYLGIGAWIAPAVLIAPLTRLPWAIGRGRLLIALGGLLLLCAAIFVVAKRWSRLAREVVEAGRLWATFRRSPGPMAAAGIMALLVQAAYILVWYDLAGALGIHLPVQAWLVLVPLVSLVAMAPITISGLGLREGAWVLLLQPLGVPAADAIRVSLLFFVANMVVGGVGGITYITLGMGQAAPAQAT